MHAPAPAPSRWVTRFAPLILAGGSVLDVACGSGRHLRWLAARGYRVTGVDRDAASVEPLRGFAEIVVADLERGGGGGGGDEGDGGAWPLAERRFDGIVVTHYLWRPLWPRLAAALAPGGVLIYETFALGQERYGRPSNPAFLLAPGELLAAFPGLAIVAYEDGLEANPERRVQRLVAVAPSATPADRPAAAPGTDPAAPGSPPRIEPFEPRRLHP